MYCSSLNVNKINCSTVLSNVFCKCHVHPISIPIRSKPQSTDSPSTQAKFQALKQAYPNKVVILSNTAGYAARDPTGSGAASLSQNTGVPVLPHDGPKPGCSGAIMQYFAARPELGVTHPSQVAVVGDRLLTDIYMANSGGMYGLWTRDGVVPPQGMVGMVSLWRWKLCVRSWVLFSM